MPVVHGNDSAKRVLRHFLRRDELDHPQGVAVTCNNLVQYLPDAEIVSGKGNVGFVEAVVARRAMTVTAVVTALLRVQTEANHGLKQKLSAEHIRILNLKFGDTQVQEIFSLAGFA